MGIFSGNFWPADIKASVRTPLAILRPRAEELTLITNGILVGRVSTARDEDEKWVSHSLDVVVPSLKDFRQRILTIRHRIFMIYPSYVDAAIFERSPLEQLTSLSLTLKPRNKSENEASTDVELAVLLKKVLQSDQVKSNLMSLIALANEAIADGISQPPQNPPDDQAEQDVETEKPGPMPRLDPDVTGET